MKEICSDTLICQYAPVIVASMGMFFLIYVIVILLLKLKGSMHAPLKRGFATRIVSLIFATSSLTLSYPMFYKSELIKDPLFGSDAYSCLVVAYTCGYFLFDTIFCIVYFNETGPAFLFHGIACLLSFILGLIPFVQAFAPVMLMFEASTVFLNIHWFCDKTGYSGSRLQFINGILLLSSFFLVRIVWGTGKLYQAISMLLLQRDRVKVPLLVEFYCISGAGIGLLNFFWFYAMIKSVQKRFSAPSKGAKKIE